MGLAEVRGLVLHGVEGVPVRIEVDVSQGLPSIGVVGLPDATIGESRWRVRSAISNSGLSWPSTRLTIGLSPAEVPKHGAGLDLAIAVGILAATSQITVPAGLAFIGELGLDGRVHPVRGALALIAAARAQGITRLFLPAVNASDLIADVECVGVRDLLHLCAVLRGTAVPEALPQALDLEMSTPELDMADVRGHAHARFGLEVAAAGGHHLLMSGPPGVGKTLLAERIPGLLPDLDDAQALAATSIASLAGIEPLDGALVRRAPFQAPHHTTTVAAMSGSVRGRSVTPGAVTLAHAGVLFLDEAPEFTRPALECLRQPLEHGHISIDRASLSVRMPARFQLILAANPCPCGQAGAQCACTSLTRRRYAERLSGPLLDRIDLRLTVRKPARSELTSAPGEGSSAIADRVREARERAARRYADVGWSLNSGIPGGELRGRFRVSARAADILDRFEALSLRGVDRILRVSWTIADLAGVDQPGPDHVAMAASMRGIDDGL